MRISVDIGTERAPDDTVTKENVRISFRVRGPKLAQLRDAQELLGLDSLTETYQYLALRGLETISNQLMQRKVFRDAMGRINVEELLPLLGPLFGETAQNPKPVEKVP